MEQLQRLQYYNELLAWSNNLIMSDGIAEHRSHLYSKVKKFEDSLLRVNKERLSNEDIFKFSKIADEIYREFNYNDLFIDESSLVVKRKEGEVKRVPIGEHRLPPLPYAYNALEPYIDEEIMRLHHSEHHNSYIEGLNKAEKEMEKARRKNNFDLIKHWQREAAFNGAGHYLHTIFWNSMSPKGGGNPRGSLAEQINTDFVSFDRFKEHFSESAKNVEAVGWAILVWAPQARRLEILQAEKHQNLSQWDVVPLLPLDVWEHAYYLQYKNNRGLYVDNWWNVVDWNYVSDRFQKAKQLQW